VPRSGGRPTTAIGVAAVTPDTELGSNDANRTGVGVVSTVAPRDFEQRGASSISAIASGGAVSTSRRLPRRFTQPLSRRSEAGALLVGVGEAAHFAIAQQPGDLRNRHVGVLQVPIGQIRP